MLKRWQHITLFIILISLITPPAVSANSIQSLSASGGGEQNSTITIHTTIQGSQANNTNLHFVITAPDGIVVASHQFNDVPHLSDGETFSYSWQTNNTNFPAQGNHTVSVCWSPGNSTNCTHGSASTTFYSANTLGILLVPLGFLLARWVRRSQRRDD